MSATLASPITAIYLTALFTRPFRLNSNVDKKQAFKCLFKIPLLLEIVNFNFYFLIFLVKI